MTRDPLTLSMIVLSIAVGLMALPGHAAPDRCAPRDVVVHHLTENAGEVRRAIGLSGDGLVVETFSSAAGGWTIVLTRPDGISCIAASGRHFETLSDAAPIGDPA